eukprot:6196472-Pleurochrysis_carterae.AAC.6
MASDASPVFKEYNDRHFPTVGRPTSCQDRLGTLRSRLTSVACLSWPLCASLSMQSGFTRHTKFVSDQHINYHCVTLTAKAVHIAVAYDNCKVLLDSLYANERKVHSFVNRLLCDALPTATTLVELSMRHCKANVQAQNSAEAPMFALGAGKATLKRLDSFVAQDATTDKSLDKALHYLRGAMRCHNTQEI